jgi:hypothetical protein
MNLLKVIEDIQTVDPEFTDRINPRRSAIRYMASFGSKVAAAALPLAMGSLFNKAYGQSLPSGVIAVLNLALTAEYLESTFYNQALTASTLTIPADERPGLEIIRLDENNHVKVLLGPLGTNAKPKPTFDFTGGSGSGNGPFANVFSNYTTFLAVAQAFEDTGVRAYKGGAADLMVNPTILTVALNIHSVEARHNAHIRRARLRAGVANLKSWVTGATAASQGIPSTAADPVYAGETATSQAGVELSGIVSASAAGEAFDEPINAATATAILSLFIKK